MSLAFSSLTGILPAVSLGKHQPGVDKPDPKTWKANFRCAMNSLPDIEEVKDKSIKKGNNAFRVYRMLPLSERPSKKGRRTDLLTLGSLAMDDSASGISLFAHLWLAPWRILPPLPGRGNDSQGPRGRKAFGNLAVYRLTRVQINVCTCSYVCKLTCVQTHTYAG